MYIYVRFINAVYYYFVFYIHSRVTIMRCICVRARVLLECA